MTKVLLSSARNFHTETENFGAEKMEKPFTSSYWRFTPLPNLLPIIHKDKERHSEHKTKHSTKS